MSVCDSGGRLSWISSAPASGWACWDLFDPQVSGRPPPISQGFRKEVESQVGGGSRSVDTRDVAPGVPLRSLTDLCERALSVCERELRGMARRSGFKRAHEFRKPVPAGCGVAGQVIAPQANRPSCRDEEE